MEFIDLDASVFTAPPPFGGQAEASAILSSSDLADYEIARWIFDLTDAGVNNGVVQIIARGNIVPEPSVGLLSMLACCLLLGCTRRRSR